MHLIAPHSSIKERRGSRAWSSVGTMPSRLPYAFGALHTPLSVRLRPSARPSITRNVIRTYASAKRPVRMENGRTTDAQAVYRDFAPSRKSVVLATSSATGEPHASVSPFVLDDARNIYVVRHPNHYQAVATLTLL